MPRWAEMIVFAVVGVVITVSIMVYARFSTRKAREPSIEVAASIAAATPDTAESSPDATEAARDLAEIERAAKRAVDRASPSSRRPAAPKPAVERKEPEAPVPAAVDADANPPAPEVLAGPPEPPGADPAADPDKAGAGEEEDAEDEKLELDPGDEKKKDEPVKEEWSGPKPGSKAELTLLVEAQNTLERLHNLKLRPDVTPEASKQEAAKLARILNQLAPETRKELQAVINAGYNARNAARDRSPEMGAHEARPADLGQHQHGQYDDTPSDVKALDERIGSLRSRHGVTAPARRPTAVAPVNPSTLPAVQPRATNPSGDGQGLPSVQPSPL